VDGRSTFHRMVVDLSMSLHDRPKDVSKGTHTRSKQEFWTPTDSILWHWSPPAFMGIWDGGILGTYPIHTGKSRRSKKYVPPPEPNATADTLQSTFSKLDLYPKSRSKVKLVGFIQSKITQTQSIGPDVARTHMKKSIHCMYHQDSLPEQVPGQPQVLWILGPGQYDLTLPEP
jgi:hypothetical protein